MTDDTYLRYVLGVLRLDWSTLDLRRHGNGFLQVDLPWDMRLHIWNPELEPAQRVPTPIHDHRFSFRSTVLYGNQHHWVYEVFPDYEGPTHEVFEAIPRHDEDTGLVGTGRMVWVGDPIKHTIPTGESYTFGAGRYHETPTVEYTITVMEKTAISPGHRPRVLCPVGAEPDNDYDRYQIPVSQRKEQLDLAKSALEEVRLRWLTP